MASVLCPSSMPQLSASTRSPSCTQELLVSHHSLKGTANQINVLDHIRCRMLLTLWSTLLMLCNCIMTLSCNPTSTLCLQICFRQLYINLEKGQSLVYWKTICLTQGDVLICQVCTLFPVVSVPRSVGPGDAPSMGHRPHHPGRLSGVCCSGLDLCLPLDEKENSKQVHMLR